MVRGFKADAKRKSLALREKLGIKEDESLNCFSLAEYLGIPIHPVDKLRQFGMATEEINLICYLKGKQEFSAVTIAVRYGHLIIYNQGHSEARINSDLAHEISHIILEHEFSSISYIKKGIREFDQDKEDEANWMACCLLLPEDGLVWALKRKMSLQNIADHFNISLKMVQWRYNSTGMVNRMKFISRPSTKKSTIK